MWVFYVMSLLPVAVGAYLWITRKEVVWWEWLISTGSAFLFALIFQGLAVLGMTSDTQTLSGKVVCGLYYPEWTEEHTETYTETHTYTDSDGNTQTETEIKTRDVTETHSEDWESLVDYGDGQESLDISRERFKEIVANSLPRRVHRTRTDGTTISGDPNVYVYQIKAEYLMPVTKTGVWQNKVKACPSVFSYVEVPKTVDVYNYPSNRDSYSSDRVMGVGAISVKEWDRMNTRLGHTKKVNVIIVGFAKDSSISNYQEAKWVGGKKNDLVLCVGWTGQEKWTKVFGWTEQEIVKRNLETILLQNDINNSIIPKIEAEIRKNYVIKDWSKFDYLTVEPPTWTYYLFFFLMVGIQFGIWFYMFQNEYDKGMGGSIRSYYNYNRIYRTR